MTVHCRALAKNTHISQVVNFPERVDLLPVFCVQYCGIIHVHTIPAYFVSHNLTNHNPSVPDIHDGAREETHGAGSEPNAHSQAEV